jgi:hypothetical protein
MTASKDFSVRFPEIREKVATKHAEFLGKYKQVFLKKVAEREMSRDLIYAKILLVAKVFVDSGVVDSSKEVDIGAPNGNYARSVALVSKLSPFCIYILNDGKNVTITDSVAIPAQNNIENRLVLVSSSRMAHAECRDVLEPGFSWEDLCMTLLDCIHMVIYNRSEVIKEHFLNSVEGSNG